MAIAVSSLGTSDQLTNSLTGKTAVQQNAAVSDASTASDKRSTASPESTKVRLSTYGQVKSAFANLQASAQNLAATARSSTSTVSDIKKAAESFVDDYNTVLATTRSTASSSESAKSSSSAADQASTQTLAVSSSDNRARQAGKDLRDTLSQSGFTSDLDKAGVSQTADGSLEIDEQKFTQELQKNPTEVQASLSGTADKVAQAATTELSSADSSSGGTADTFNQRQSSLETQQQNQQATEQASQNKIKEQASQGSNASNAIAAYQALFIR